MSAKESSAGSNDSSRSRFDFARRVREHFEFLEKELRFVEVESGPTLVRYKKDDIEVDIYHGRRSYEVGTGVSLAGSHHSLEAIIRATDAAAAAAYIQMTATSPEQLAPALQNNSVALKRYGMAALRGEPEFFALLELQQKKWRKEFALDVLVYQLRPQAYEAFRRGDYARAAELYGRIRPRLTPVEQKKLAIAESRRQ